ncbi:uncharacterized protein LOC117123053 [Anneissia japonica]|uniref:uncharacterized protein LOC117123053 n=1 Tax=Anneissia japonica TaxID=1529436 RepID=UPI00142586F3|nr:uncharacterized protein LOC117123053 [Anneissia japonica]
MMELQEIRLNDGYSDNLGFVHSKIDCYGRQGSTSFIYKHVKGNEIFNESSLDIKTKNHPNTLENNEQNDCTNPKNNEDPSATNEIYSGSKTTEYDNLSDYKHNTIAPSIRAGIGITITNDKCLDIYNRLTRAFDMLSHIEEIQKKWMQANNINVTLATITRNYKVKQNISVIKELISIVTRLGNYEDEYFYNHPILDQIQQEIREAHDAAENAYFCDHVTERSKLEEYMSTMLASLTKVLDSFSSFCSEYNGTSTNPHGCSQILEQIRNVRSKLRTGYQGIYSKML